MSYDPEYMKELFGDDYEKYMPASSSKPESGPRSNKKGGAPKRPDGEPNRQGRTPDKPSAESEGGSGGRFYSFDVSSNTQSGHNRDLPAGDIPEPGPEELHEPDDFSVNFDFDKEYRDVPENRPLRQRREKRTGCLGGLLLAAFIICISLLLASLLWLAASDILGLSGADEQVNVTVPKEYTIDGITDILYDSGLIKHKFLFKLYAGFSNAEEKIVGGSYTLNKNFDYRALVHGMMARSKTRVEIKVSIPEGYTLAQIFTLLEKNGVCASNELWEAAANYDFDYSFLDKSTLGNERRLEGFLFPNTYNFYVDSTPEQTISKMLNEFKRKFTEEYTERAAELGYSIRDIIIIASMIEKEAGANEERARIASVMYNRLASSDFPKLQIDATIHYAIAGTGQQFSTELDSPYNTYQHDGLPPGPIANPGLESIKAALYPESTGYYFYALGKSGTHEFFKTRSAHEAFVASDEYGG